MYDRASGIEDQLIRWRRAIHAHPELGLQEHQTALLVYQTLKEAGIEVQSGLSETGVIGLIGGPGEKTVALRADMDALPIQEETGASYQSKISQVMHACGHDGHTAMLLGASILLKEALPQLKGNVKLIFQPAEEQSLVGRGGARQMVAEGVLECPPVSSIVAVHLDPDLPLGTAGIREGPLMASSTTLEILVHGKEAHGARPHQGVDSIYIAAHIVLALQGLVTRETDALDPKLITIGEIRGGTSPNVLSSSVLMRGVIRTLSPGMKEHVQELVARRSQEIARALGGDATPSFQTLYPPLVNDKGLAVLARQVCADHPGIVRIEELDSPRLGGEDFAFYSEKVPGFMFRLGCGTPGKKRPLHSSVFDFDEKVLPIGCALMATMVCRILEER